MDLISDHPFWPLSNGLIRSFPSLGSDLQCEVLVLGAGITGALCAYHLAKAGMDVAVVDKRDVASGSTSASTAMLQYEIDTPLTRLIGMLGKADAERAYQACLESIDKIGVICREIGDSCGFTRRSSVYLASREKDVPDLRAEHAARRAAGIEVDLLSQADIEARFSFSRPAALLSRDAAEVDVYRLAHQLLHRSQEMGARIFDRTGMKSYEESRHGVVVAMTGGATVRARWLVFATGYEAVEVLKGGIVSLHSSFALISEPLGTFPGWWERCLIWETARPYLYMRTTADGRAIVGGADEKYRNPIRRDAAVGRKAGKLEKQFREMFPAMDFQPAYAWAGTFGETKDGLAYIGTAPDRPRCFFTLGFGGNGITYSVMAAEILRDRIQGKNHPDARLFRFDR